MGCQSLHQSQQSTDGSGSPPAPPMNPSSSFPGSSYFTSKGSKWAKQASEESPCYSFPLSSFWKQTSSEIAESPKGNTADDTPEFTADAKLSRQDVQDWNTTRLFDARPDDSSSKSVMQGPSYSNSDWNVTRSFDVRPVIPQQSIDPPRPAREGYEWVWFPAGYWAERELPGILSPQSNPEGRRNSKSFFFSRAADRKSNGSEDSTSPRGSRRFWGSFSSKVAKQYTNQSFKGSSTHGSAISSTNSERFLNSLQSMSPSYPRYVSPSGEPEGLYSKTKRNVSTKRYLGVPFSRKKKTTVGNDTLFRQERWLIFLQKIETPPLASSRPLSSTGQTARILEGAISYFDTYEEKNTGEPSTITPASSNASFGSKRQWKFGTAPWHRRLSDNSISVSSSIYDLLVGRTPIGTPKSESRYVGATGKSYTKVEISEPGAPTFLPSVSVPEAQRVDTPLWLPKRDPRRGFMSNMFPHVNEQKISEKYSLDTTRPRRDTTQSSLRNFLRTPTLLNAPASRRESSDSEHGSSLRKSPTNRSFASQYLSKSQLFELNIPDHLPSSPLCPTNPMHTSKGLGICPLHGRKRTRSRQSIAGIRRSPTPEIIVTSD
ncbi:hypothetical protein DSL72_002218 [Monilinia vaccinii-corymbosi]|uniref:Uncharacterized protein n=1 Tax=Monilinia vaccinii-corymbosi TaxID=61207 RepID=A0A8A3PC18_9HELO|nr:hypothetical protein DSL72_002218 [Monilinia vaccinii-corymbosi]